MACVAAPASTVRDAQQGATVFTMLAILPMMLLMIIVNAPNSIIAKVLTYVPYTASVTALMRISLVDVPTYELVASLAILTVSVIIVIKLSAKIFRTGILMYGQKMKLKDVILSRFVLTWFASACFRLLVLPHHDSERQKRKA